MDSGQQAIQANGPDIILPDQHPLQVGRSLSCASELTEAFKPMSRQMP